MARRIVAPIYRGRVLVVDDDDGFRTFLTSALKQFGQDVEARANGAEALNALRSMDFDLVLTDLWMPEMSGMDLLRCVTEERPDTPVIMISGHGEVDNTIEALRRGAYDFLLKPLEGLDFLYRSVNRALERHQLLVDKKRAEERLRIAFEEQNRELRRTKLIQEIGEFLQSAYDTDELLHMMLTAITSGFAAGFNRAAVFLVDEDANYLSGTMALGPMSQEEAGRIWHSIVREEVGLADLMRRSPAEDSEICRRVRQMGVPLSSGEDPIVRLLDERRTERITAWDHSGDLTQRLWRELGFEFFVVAPLLAGGRVLGVIIADNRFTGREIDEDHLRMLTVLANQGAMALDNALAYKRVSEHIVSLRQTQQDLIASERLAAIGKMAAQVAHEIRNPLAAIGGFARRILVKHASDTQTKQACDIIVQQVVRLESSLRNITDFARPVHPEMELGNVNAAVQATRDVLQDMAETGKIQIQLALDPNLPDTFFDPSQIQQVLLNVGKNGIEAMGSGGRLTFRTFTSDGYIVVEVADTGEGMDDRILDSAFDPFFTTKSIGTGLGLAVTQKLVSEHGGRVEILSDKESGTRVRMLLPIRTEAPPSDGPRRDRKMDQEAF